MNTQQPISYLSNLSTPPVDAAAAIRLSLSSTPRGRPISSSGSKLIIAPLVGSPASARSEHIVPRSRPAQVAAPYFLPVAETGGSRPRMQDPLLRPAPIVAKPVMTPTLTSPVPMALFGPRGPERHVQVSMRVVTHCKIISVYRPTVLCGSISAVVNGSISGISAVTGGGQGRARPAGSIFAPWRRKGKCKLIRWRSTVATMQLVQITAN